MELSERNRSDIRELIELLGLPFLQSTTGITKAVIYRWIAKEHPQETMAIKHFNRLRSLLCLIARNRNYFDEHQRIIIDLFKENGMDYNHHIDYFISEYPRIYKTHQEQLSITESAYGDDFDYYNDSFNPLYMTLVSDDKFINYLIMPPTSVLTEVINKLNTKNCLMNIINLRKGAVNVLKNNSRIMQKEILRFCNHYSNNQQAMSLQISEAMSKISQEANISSSDAFYHLLYYHLGRIMLRSNEYFSSDEFSGNILSEVHNKDLLSFYKDVSLEVVNNSLDELLKDPFIDFQYPDKVYEFPKCKIDEILLDFNNDENYKKKQNFQTMIKNFIADDCLDKFDTDQYYTFTFWNTMKQMQNKEFNVRYKRKCSHLKKQYINRQFSSCIEFLNRTSDEKTFKEHLSNRDLKYDLINYTPLQKLELWMKIKHIASHLILESKLYTQLERSKKD